MLGLEAVVALLETVPSVASLPCLTGWDQRGAQLPGSAQTYILQIFSYLGSRNNSLHLILAAMGSDFAPIEYLLLLHSDLRGLL